MAQILKNSPEGMDGWFDGQSHPQNTVLNFPPLYNPFFIWFAAPNQLIQMPNSWGISSGHKPIRNAKLSHAPTKTSENFALTVEIYNHIPVFEHAHVSIWTRVRKQCIDARHIEYFGFGWREVTLEFETPPFTGQMELILESRRMSSLGAYSGIDWICYTKAFTITKSTTNKPDPNHRPYIESMLW